MTTKQEWKECAERRLVENLALRTVVNQIRETLLNNDKGFHTRIRHALDLIDIFDEVGK